MPRGERSCLAGVNSFGYSGTNAHAILRECGVRSNGHASSVRPYEIVVLSAKSTESLRQMAEIWTSYLTQDAAPRLPDIAYTAALGRTHLRHRLAIVGADKADIAQKLMSWRDGRPAEGLSAGQASSRRKLKTAFVFTGHGAHAQMGRQPRDGTAVQSGDRADRKRWWIRSLDCRCTTCCSVRRRSS